MLWAMSPIWPSFLAALAATLIFGAATALMVVAAGGAR
jgi:hypothetical protein